MDENYLEAETEWLNEFIEDFIEQEMESTNSSDDLQPWEIDLSKIANVPIFMIASTADSLCQPDDVQQLLERVRRDDMTVALTSIEGASHSDMLSGKNLEHIERYVIPALMKYTKKPENIIKRAFSTNKTEGETTNDQSWFQMTVEAVAWTLGEEFIDYIF